MSRSNGFTLIELLFAFVLFALVVTVCMPYLQIDGVQKTSEIDTEFYIQVNEVIQRHQLSQSKILTMDQVQEAVLHLGARCESVSDVDRKLEGHWIQISKGAQSVVWWCRVEDTVEGAQRSQEVGS